MLLHSNREKSLWAITFLTARGVPDLCYSETGSLGDSPVEMTSLSWPS